VDTLQACREVCGGEGYDARNRFGRLKADADIFTTFEGANAVQLGDQAAKEGSWDLRTSGLAKARAGVTSLAEINRVTVE